MKKVTKKSITKNLVRLKMTPSKVQAGYIVFLEKEAYS